MGLRIGIDIGINIGINIGMRIGIHVWIDKNLDSPRVSLPRVEGDHGVHLKRDEWIIGRWRQFAQG